MLSLTMDDVLCIETLITTSYRKAFEEARKESERIGPWISKIWDEMFGDRKPSSLAEGMGMAMVARSEYYQREAAGTLPDLGD